LIKANADAIVEIEYLRATEITEQYVLAAHHDGDWTEDELDEVKKAQAFVKNLKEEK